MNTSPDQELLNLLRAIVAKDEASSALLTRLAQNLTKLQDQIAGLRRDVDRIRQQGENGGFSGH